MPRRPFSWMRVLLAAGLCAAVLLTRWGRARSGNFSQGDFQQFAPPIPEESDLSSKLVEENATPSKLPVYKITIAPQEFRRLEASTYSNERCPVTFSAEGKTYQKAQMRYRGAWARGWPKKPLKIFFEDGDEFEGQHCVNLNSGWRDPAFVREVLAYHVYEACGVPASKSRLVRVEVNGKFQGVYVEVEQPGKAFLKRNNLKGAAVYKANSSANQADERDLGSLQAFTHHYEKETRKKEDAKALQDFCHELATTRDVVGFFNRRVDLDKYVNYLAATILIQHWDGFNKNHFIVQDGESGKWFILPWDLDRTLGDHWNWSFSEASLPLPLGTKDAPGITGWNRLQDRFFSEPALRAFLVNRLDQLLKTEFTTEKIFPVLDQLEATLGADRDLEYRRWPRQSPDMHRGIAEVKKFVEHRRSFLEKELRKLKRDSVVASIESR